MRVSVIPSSDLSPEQIKSWSRIQQANPELASPYFCPEYTMAVAAVRDDVYVAVLEELGQTVGFFPFQRRWGRIGRPVGGPLSDYQAVIVPRAYQWSAEELIRGCGLRAWDFDHLLASQKPFEPYHRIRRGSPVLDLSAGYQEYVTKRRESRTSVFRKTGRKTRKLEREVGRLRFEVSVKDKEVLRWLLRLKSAQYTRTNLVDLFGFDWTVQLLERIHETRTQSFAGVLSALYAGDHLVAAHIGMRSCSVWHHWFPVYDTSFGQYSPGIILLLKMAESAETMGIVTIDMGKGTPEYKRRQATGSVPIAEGSVEVSSALSSIRNLNDRVETWIRRTPLLVPARIPGRLFRRIQCRLKYR